MKPVFIKLTFPHYKTRTDKYCFVNPELIAQMVEYNSEGIKATKLVMRDNWSVEVEESVEQIRDLIDRCYGCCYNYTYPP